jgi:hypothetical protein
MKITKSFLKQLIKEEIAKEAAFKKVDESSLNEENTLLKYPELGKALQGGKINPELFIKGLQFYAENPDEVNKISGKTKSAPADSFEEIFRIMDSFARKNPTYSEKIKQLRGQIYPRYAKRAATRASYDASRRMHPQHKYDQELKQMSRKLGKPEDWWRRSSGLDE